MLYPVMPIFLKSIGFSIVLIGVLEGFAEATAGLSKGYFGKLSDQSGKRVPFVQLGYALSAIAKPMMAIFVYPFWIFLARTLDRLGKGVRTGARDAILSEEATAKTKGKVFGFHRSMDTLGAVLGPLLALLYLQWHPQDYISLFYIAFLPGLLAIVSTLLLKDRNKQTPKSGKVVSFFSFLRYWKDSPPAYRQVLLGLLAFALVNSSDVFLLLKVKEAGINDTQVIGIYIFYNLVFALAALPLGILADKIGLKKIFIAGLITFTLVYLGMGLTDNVYVFTSLFFLYGIYAAATDGISKAWISNLVQKADTATAIGTYAALQSVCALIASSFAGIIWYQFGATSTFLFTALSTLIIVVYFLFRKLEC
jgi:MFS family permease